MGKQSNLTREKAHSSGFNLLRAAIVRFKRAPQGTREQTMAFERILRTLASNGGRSKYTKCQQGLRRAT